METILIDGSDSGYLSCDEGHPQAGEAPEEASDLASANIQD